MMRNTIFTLSLLSLSLTNCTTKKIEEVSRPSSEKITAKKNIKYLKKRKKRKTAIAQTNRPKETVNLVNSEEKSLDRKVKNSNISQLLPNFKAEALFDFETSDFFPIVKRFHEQDIKLIIKPGDNQSLDRPNRQQLAHVENLSFNIKRLK